MTRTFDQGTKSKLSQLFTDGIGTLQEIEDLGASLTDTIKAVAEEIDCKPSVLKKAIKIAFKSKLTETNEEQEEINDLLILVGRNI